MNKKFQYNTLTYAINTLRMGGFNTNFSLNGNVMVGNGNQFSRRRFENYYCLSL